MDPLSIQATSAAAWTRSLGNPPGELAAVLRAGRVIAGDVLQTLTGGTVLIGIGRHRVPARAQAELHPGQRYLFEVLAPGDPVELRVLSTEQLSEESNLARALRSVLSSEQPLGAMLEALQGQLRRGAPDAGEGQAALERLLAALSSQAFQPGQGGSELAAKLRAGGLQYESRWIELALNHLSPHDAERLQGELRTLFLADWSASAGDPDSHTLESALRLALRGLFADADPRSDLPAAIERWIAGSSPALPRDLGGLLELAVERAGLGRGGEAWLAQLRRFEVDRWPRGLRDALLRGLAAVEAVGEPRDLRSLAREIAGLATDLKAELLRASRGLEEGPIRDAIERTLKNLEAEQLLNVARGSAREPVQWSVPVFDGARWTTAHIFVHRDADGRARTQEGAAHGAHRFSLAVEFSQTGPVHVDLLVREGSLALRVVASRDEVVEHLRARLPELEQHLALGGRAVLATAALAPEEQLRVGDAVENVRFLRDHHLMDLSG